MKSMLFTADCDSLYCNSPPAVAPRVGSYRQSWLISMSFGTWGNLELTADRDLRRQNSPFIGAQIQFITKTIV